MAKKKKVLKIIGKTALIVLLTVVVAVSGYAVYFAGSFNRIQDDLTLSPTRGDNQSHLQTNVQYDLFSWNIGFGAYSDDYSFFMDGGKYARGFSKEAVEQNLSAMQLSFFKAGNQYSKDGFDFICYQEVDFDSTRSYHIDQKKIMTDFHAGFSAVYAQNYNSPYILYPFNEPHGANKSGLLTLSKYQIEKAVRKQVPVENGFMKYFDLDRCYSKSRIKVQGERELVLINLHLSAYTSDGTIAIEQLKILLEDCKQEIAKGNYVICAGDFNKDLIGYEDKDEGSSAQLFGDTSSTEGWAKQINSEVFKDTGMGKVDYTKYDDGNHVPTCRNANRPYSEGNKVYIVDGFLVSANVLVVKAAAIDLKFKNSDHNPTVLNFKLI